MTYLEPISKIFNEKVTSKRENFILGNVNLFDFIMGKPKKGYINIAFVRDIPALQKHLRMLPYTKRLITGWRKGSKCHHFITLNDRMAKAVKEFIFPFHDIDHDVFKVYPLQSELKQPIMKRKEIVYIDHSSTSNNNYKDIVRTLEKVGQVSKLPCLFISWKFRDVVDELIKDSEHVSTMGYDDYDFASHYGILTETRSKKYARFSITRKLMIYIASGIIPVLYRDCKAAIEYLQDEHLNFEIYDKAEDLKCLSERTYFPNWEPYRFTMEHNYTKIIEIMNRVGERYKYVVPDKIGMAKRLQVTYGNGEIKVFKSLQDVDKKLLEGPNKGRTITETKIIDV